MSAPPCRPLARFRPRPAPPPFPHRPRVPPRPTKYGRAIYPYSRKRLLPVHLPSESTVISGPSVSGSSIPRFVATKMPNHAPSSYAFFLAHTMRRGMGRAAPRHRHGRARYRMRSGMSSVTDGRVHGCPGLTLTSALTANRMLDSFVPFCDIGRLGGRFRPPARIAIVPACPLLPRNYAGK